MLCRCIRLDPLAEWEQFNLGPQPGYRRLRKPARRGHRAGSGGAHAADRVPLHAIKSDAEGRVSTLSALQYTVNTYYRLRVHSNLY